MENLTIMDLKEQDPKLFDKTIKQLVKRAAKNGQLIYFYNQSRSLVVEYEAQLLRRNEENYFENFYEIEVFLEELKFTYEFAKYMIDYLKQDNKFTRKINKIIDKQTKKIIKKLIKHVKGGKHELQI